MPKPFEQYNRSNKWDLPEIIDPERICVCFEIPNERYHIRAFWTALYKLTLWNSWEADSEKTGTKVAQVWRDVWTKAWEDETTMGCGCNERIVTNERVNEDGTIEVSYDDGVTWEEKPNDPRFNSPVFSPIAGANGSAKKCTGANSAIKAFENAKDDASNLLATAGGIVDFLAAVAAAVASVGVSLPIALVVALMGAVINAIVAGTQAEFDDSFTTQVWDDFFCALYCNMEDDASFTEQGWQQVINFCDGITEYPAGDWLSHMVKTFGPVGLTNAARSGLQGTRTCDSCDCGCGADCTFVWEGTQYTTKTPAVVGDWTFSGPDCDASSYRCFTLGNYIQLGSLGGICVSSLRYSIARIGSSQCVITVNGTDAYIDTMSGMATNGTPQVARVFNFPQPVEISTIRFAPLGGTALYIREVEFSVCED